MYCLNFFLVNHIFADLTKKNTVSANRGFDRMLGNAFSNEYWIDRTFDKNIFDFFHCKIDFMPDLKCFISLSGK